MREAVVTEELGLYGDEKLERLERGRIAVDFFACRRQRVLDRGVMIRRVRRVRPAFQPRLRMPRQAAFGAAVRQPCERLRRRYDTTMAYDFMWARMGLPDRRRIDRHHEKHTAHGHSQGR